MRVRDQGEEALHHLISSSLPFSSLVLADSVESLRLARNRHRRLSWRARVVKGLWAPGRKEGKSPLLLTVYYVMKLGLLGVL